MQFQFILHVLGDEASSELVSAGTQISRGLSSGKQEFEAEDTLDPIGRPVKKLEADIQCSGEAEYVDDIAPVPNELYAAYVYSKQASCRLDRIDPEPALVKTSMIHTIEYKNR